tara:strand:+ start:59 stop:1477 length:1419 start_codon:yes stop_codon:yes gene_type:complete
MNALILTLGLMLGQTPYFPGMSRPALENLKLEQSSGPVIFIIVDALRPDHLTPYGFDRPTSPFLHGLADEGVILTRAYVNANWTRPSSTSILTGLLPREHKVETQNAVLPKDVDTLAEHLKKKGIPTAGIIANGNASSAFGLSQGFDYYIDANNTWGNLPNARDVVSHAKDYIYKNKTEPFFLFLFLIDPHNPYRAPQIYEDAFVRNPEVKLIDTPHWEKQKYSKQQIERMLDTYDASVRFTDDALGELFDYLRQLQIYEKSTILVSADHGEAFGEHDVYMHAHHLYEEIIRVPLIIKQPGWQHPGTYYSGLFESVDFVPTILGFYGIDTPTTLSGRNWTQITPIQEQKNRTIFSDFYHFGIKRQTLIKGAHKIVYSLPADKKDYIKTVGNPKLLPSVSFVDHNIKFFDLHKDPLEKNDLYSLENTKAAPWKELFTTLLMHIEKRGQANPNLENSTLSKQTLSNLKALGYIQ